MLTSALDDYEEGTWPLPVYVVLRGLYEDQDLAGVYFALDHAQAAFPLRTIPAVNKPHYRAGERVGQWVERKDHHDRRTWWNCLDGQDAVTIIECQSALQHVRVTVRGKTVMIFPELPDSGSATSC